MLNPKFPLLGFEIYHLVKVHLLFRHRRHRLVLMMIRCLVIDHPNELISPDVFV